MKQKRLIGNAVQKHTVEFDRSDIRRYATAIGSTNQLHFDPAIAKKAGFSDIIAPISMAATLGRHNHIIAMLEVHPKNVLHSEQTIELRRPLAAGDELRVVSVVSDVHERPIGNSTTGFVTIEDRGTDAKGKAVFFVRRVLAVRGGFPRR